MAIDQTKLKKTRHPGVFKTPDGRLWARAAVRLPNGRVVTQRRLLPVGASEADAVLAVEDLRVTIKNPPEPLPSASTATPLRPDTSPRQRFDVFCDGWLETRERRVTPSTAETYKAVVKNYIKPRLGWMECQDITRQAIESWVVWAEERRQGNGKPYTQDSMRQWWRCLSTIISDMVADLNLPRDPTLRVRKPERPELAPVREQNTLGAAAIDSLLEACKVKFPTRLAEVAMMALTGARAGEVYALKWDAVDFQKNQIVIKRALSRGKLLERTKTKAQRVVPIHADLAEILKAHHDAQLVRFAKRQAEAKAHGEPEVTDIGMVFVSDKWTIRDPKSAKKMWAVLCKQGGITQRVSPQVLRRSLNTQLLAGGVDRITLRSIMGHTSEQMTQRYAGIGDAAKAQAVALIRPKAEVAAEPAKRQTVMAPMAEA